MTRLGNKGRNDGPVLALPAASVDVWAAGFSPAFLSDGYCLCYVFFPGGLRWAGFSSYGRASASLSSSFSVGASLSLG